MKKLVTLLAVLGCGGCMPQSNVVGGPQSKPVLVQDVTIDNLIKNSPSGIEYVEVPGHGDPPSTEKDSAVRRRVSENLAIIDAQQKLIHQLEQDPNVPHDKIQGLLSHIEIGTVQYGYDDACNLTLKIQKSLVYGQPALQ